MRRNRIIWFVLWLLSLVGISFFGGPVSYGFFYTLTLIPVISLLYLLYCVIFFRIYQETDGRNFTVNDAVPYSFRLVNEYHLPFVGIRVKFFAPLSTINELSDKTEYELLPGSDITRETTLICHYRGEYEVGIREVVVTDFFRLFSITYKNREPRRVIVDPQIIRLSGLGSLQLHAMDSPTKADNLDVVTREYVLGDDVRFINWSQSARSGNLMTRETIGEEGNGVGIILDACRYGKNPSAYLPVENKQLELAIAIAMYLCENNTGASEWHIDADSAKKNCVQNRQQFETFYRQMAEVIFDKENTQQKLFATLYGSEDILSCSVVYFLLPCITESAVEMIDKLAQRNIGSVVYLVSEKAEKKPDVARPDLLTFMVVSPEAKLEEVIR